MTIIIIIISNTLLAKFSLISLHTDAFAVLEMKFLDDDHKTDDNGDGNEDTFAVLEVKILDDIDHCNNNGGYDDEKSYV